MFCRGSSVRRNWAAFVTAVKSIIADTQIIYPQIAERREPEFGIFLRHGPIGVGDKTDLKTALSSRSHTVHQHRVKEKWLTARKVNPRNSTDFLGFVEYLPYLSARESALQSRAAMQKTVIAFKQAGVG
jgi:hypothetical protein